MKAVCGAVVLLLGLTSSVLADFKSAVQAFQEGDYESALAEFKSLAAAGNNAAQYNIGVMYELGDGVDQEIDVTPTSPRRSRSQASRNDATNSRKPVR